MRPTARGWGVLACVLASAWGGVVTARSELFFLAAFAALLLVAALLAVMGRQAPFTVRRRVEPAMPAVGETASVALHVQNVATSTSAPIVVRDVAPAALDEEPPPSLPLPSLPPGGAATLRYQFTPGARGRTALGPLETAWRDPFALLTASSPVGVEEELLVVPAIEPLTDAGLWPAEGDGSSRPVQRRTSVSDDDLTTREYRQGDPLRRVHWRASARQGELMVRQEEQHSVPEARIVVDTLREGWPGVHRHGADTSPEFEAALSLVASLGVHLADAGYHVQLLETGRAQLRPPGSRPTGVRDAAFLSSLALAAPVVERSARVADVEPAAVARGPVFAVLSAPASDALEWIASNETALDVAIAFVFVGDEPHTQPESTEVLAAQGWRCVEVDAGEGAADAWQAAIDDVGNAYGYV
ncbi:DUF58 domain-containing protein [Ruicaihuangia caeni]|uniref:DUF58 domain-containing protein n=1 Tax=Ruicaihuangia caeni TaxID=3042517 RepID=A0AAW6T692_9MICO|nr:DUF58 domain-containing protein [Klugiella sp. YN-L-19]MDI2097673.1 DUF58 domain-containing protein [Klugiella sp. YN-L-19]